MPIFSQKDVREQQSLNLLLPYRVMLTLPPEGSISQLFPSPHPEIKNRLCPRYRFAVRVEALRRHCVEAFAFALRQAQRAAEFV